MISRDFSEFPALLIISQWASRIYILPEILTLDKALGLNGSGPWSEDFRRAVTVKIIGLKGDDWRRKWFKEKIDTQPDFPLSEKKYSLFP